MKKTCFTLVLFSVIFGSCSSDDSADNSNQTVDQSKIFGWWYRNANTTIFSYNSYYFGADGVYKQGFGTNYGQGTWEWIPGDSIKMTPTLNGGIAGGVVKGAVYKLDNDSLVFASESLRLSKNNPND